MQLQHPWIGSLRGVAVTARLSNNACGDACLSCGTHSVAMEGSKLLQGVCC
jgi:hypothetical protein